MHNPHSEPNKGLLVDVGEPSRNNETDDVGETGEKDCNPFFVRHCFAGEEKCFLLFLFIGDKHFIVFVVVLVDADLNFLLIELEFWMYLLIESAHFWQFFFVNLE